MAKLTLEKVSSKARKINKYKEEHYITINGSICQEDMIILNVYASDHWASRHMKKNTTNPQS